MCANLLANVLCVQYTGCLPKQCVLWSEVLGNFDSMRVGWPSSRHLPKASIRTIWPSSHLVLLSRCIPGPPTVTIFPRRSRASGSRWLRRKAATLTPARICTSMSCCRMARIWSRRFVHYEETDGVSTIGDEDQGGCSTRRHHLHFRQTLPVRVSVVPSNVSCSGGLAVRPRKPRVPNCEERLGAAHCRGDQESVAGWQ